VKTWIKRIGIFGFLFVLVKGLLWLAIPAALVAFGVSSGEAAVVAASPQGS
jgi:hypothetical protein